METLQRKTQGNLMKLNYREITHKAVCWLTWGILVLAVLAAVVGVYFEITIPAPPVAQPRPVPIPVGQRLFTVAHDGHWFVTIRVDGGGGITHHPDCPLCNQKTEKETE